MFCPIAGLVRHFSEFCGEKEDFQFSHLLQRRLILRLLFGIVSLISSNWSYHDRFREFFVFPLPGGSLRGAAQLTRPFESNEVVTFDSYRDKRVPLPAAYVSSSVGDFVEMLQSVVLKGIKTKTRSSCDKHKHNRSFGNTRKEKYNYSNFFFPGKKKMGSWAGDRKGSISLNGRRTDKNQRNLNSQTGKFFGSLVAFILA